MPENLRDFSDDEAEQKHRKADRVGKRSNKDGEPQTQSGSKTAPSKARVGSSGATPPAPKYTTNPKMSAYFPRASPQYPTKPPPRAMLYGSGGYPPVFNNPPGVPYPAVPQHQQPVPHGFSTIMASI